MAGGEESQELINQILVAEVIRAYEKRKDISVFTLFGLLRSQTLLADVIDTEFVEVGGNAFQFDGLLEGERLDKVLRTEEIECEVYGSPLGWLQKAVVIPN